MACLLTDEGVAQLFEQAASSSTDVDENLASFNYISETEMEEERQKVLARAQLIRDEGLTLDSRMPSTAAIVAAATNLPVTSPSPAIPPHLAEPLVSPRLMHAILSAAALTFAQGLPRIIVCAPDDRAAAVLKVIKEVVATAGIAGAAVWLARKVEETLQKYIGIILDALGEKKNTLIVSLLKTSALITAGTVATTSATLYLMKAFLHYLRSQVAAFRGDVETQKEESRRAHQVFDLDNGFRILACGFSQWAVATALASSGIVGVASIVLPVCLYAVTQAITESLIQRKNVYGGWGEWLLSWVIPDRRYKIWNGSIYDEHEHLITDALRCCISSQIVVDPVRSLTTGHLYERSVIYRALESRGLDPMSRKPASRLDYIPSPQAKRRAEEIARFYGAEAVPL